MSGKFTNPGEQAHQRFGNASRLFSRWFSAQISPSAFFVGVLGTASFIGLQIAVRNTVVSELSAARRTRPPPPSVRRGC